MTPQPKIAALWMLGAVVSFSLMAIAGRSVSFSLDTFEIMMYRSLIGVLIVVVGLSITKQWHKISVGHMPLHIIRNICHFTGQNLWFYALPLIPLAQVFALEFTSPLWVLLLAPIFLNERLTAPRALAAFAGFIGILLVTRPSPETLNAGTLAAALAAIGFAGSIISTKKLTARCSLGTILIWMTVLQSAFGLICAAYDGSVTLPDTTTLPWLVLIAICGIAAHYCLTTALSLAPAALVTPVDFLRLPAIAIIGFVFYSEALDVFVFFGALLIFSANYLNIWYETRKSKQ